MFCKICVLWLWLRYIGLNNVIKQLPEEIVKEIDTNTVKEFVLNGSNKVRNTIQDLIEEEEL